MVALQAELTRAKAHTRLVKIFARSKADATKARADLKGTKIIYEKVEYEAKPAGATTDEAREQSMKLTKAAKEASRQLTDVSSQAQLLEGEVNFFKSQMGECIEACDEAMSSATEQSRRAKMFEARISLLEDELDFIKRK